MTTPIALTIAGSDSSGGAGIQADLKTFSALGVYGASAITAITAQNTQGVTDIHNIPPETLRHQIEVVCDDLSVDAIKIGMIGSPEAALMVHTCLQGLTTLPIVLDPVIGTTSGATLMGDETQAVVMEKLFPLVTLITPNLPEACAFAGVPWNPDSLWREEELVALGRTLLAKGVKAVLIKGGHNQGSQSSDILVTSNTVLSFNSPRCPTPHTHGSGCTFSAAITAFLAHKYAFPEAIKGAKTYVTQAITAAHHQRQAGDFVIGIGHGPLHHFSIIWDSTASGPAD
jgi:hydroxymethylpyrimidine/phosphomethylpyrimidine kinase